MSPPPLIRTVGHHPLSNGVCTIRSSYYYTHVATLCHILKEYVTARIKVANGETAALVQSLFITCTL